MFDISIPVIVLAILLVLTIIWLIILELRLGKLLAGESGVSLEKIITKHSEEIKQLAKKELDNKKLLEILQNKFTKSIHGIGIVRFNPFHDSGGSHSFAIAFVDENNDGIVISTLYARERTNVFAKPIKSGTCNIELTEEEKGALRDAQARN